MDAVNLMNYNWHFLTNGIWNTKHISPCLLSCEAYFEEEKNFVFDTKHSLEVFIEEQT